MLKEKFDFEGILNLDVQTGSAVLVVTLLVAVDPPSVVA